MKQDAIKLCKLMGAAVIEAPCEAEAQCADLVKQGLAYGTATEDMDALTFGTAYLLRGFNSKKEPILQIDLKLLLEGFEMTQDEFIDLCILCGCDYTNTIQGMGPKTAFNLMKEHGSIEKILEHINELNDDDNKKKSRFQIPDNFLYTQSRKLFLTPDVEKDAEVLKKSIVFEKPYEAEMKEWLTGSKGFSEMKVNTGIEKLIKSQGKKNQIRLDSFFKPKQVVSSTKKVEAPKKPQGAKGASGGKKVLKKMSGAAQ